jgi:dihydroorotate dehydrogenase
VPIEKISIRNAAGIAKTPEDVLQLCNSAVTDIVVGSYTWLERRGNSGQTTGFNEREMAYANALNMPNMGKDALIQRLGCMVQLAHRHGKRLVVSVAGDEPVDYGEMALACYTAGADFVELNFGCPNKVDAGGVHKPIPSYEPELARTILGLARTRLNYASLKVGVKISPFDENNLRMLSDLADACVESGIVEEFTACNTIGNQELLLEDGSYALNYRVLGEGPVMHTGGLSGKPLKAQALPIVNLLKLWHPHMRVIALGGIFSSEDALEYLEVRADGFGCGAAYMVYGKKIFSEITQGLAEVL